MMHLTRSKTRLKAYLESNGWYLRKAKGLSPGTDCFHELRYRFGARLQTVLDVGAHHGETTFAILERFPNAVVHAFEPVRGNFEILTRAVRHLPNVTCHQLAFANQSGTIDIVLQQHSATHTLKRQSDGSDATFTERVDIATLDAFLRDRRIPRVDLLKLDVEGYELNALSGSQETLSDNPPRFILVEATLEPSADVHCFLPDIAAFLNKYSYKLFSIYDQVIWSDPPGLAFFNALFSLDTCL